MTDQERATSSGRFSSTTERGGYSSGPTEVGELPLPPPGFTPTAAASVEKVVQDSDE